MGARRRLRQRQGAGLRHRHRQGRNTRTPATCAACSRPTPTSCTRTRATRSTPPTRSKAFFSPARTPSSSYHETGKFEFINTGGYYHVLPLDPLRQFIDTAAEVQRAMGFQNEKDHPEVAPSQFEINYGYGEVVAAADQIQLYKLLCRQIANNMGYTASFLPKPVVGVNGSGMHTNVSVSKEQDQPVLGSEGPGEALRVRLGVHRPHPDARAGHLPDPESQRECVSPPRPALRSAQPDQGLGHGSRLDGARAHRQLALHARRGARQWRRMPTPT